MITVKELIDISQYFNFKVNGKDYEWDIDHYADDWMVYCQTIEVHTNLSMSSYDEAAINNTSICLCISAEDCKEIDR